MKLEESAYIILAGYMIVEHPGFKHDSPQMLIEGALSEAIKNNENNIFIIRSIIECTDDISLPFMQSLYGIKVNNINKYLMAIIFSITMSTAYKIKKELDLSYEEYFKLLFPQLNDNTDITEFKIDDNIIQKEVGKTMLLIIMLNETFKIKQEQNNKDDEFLDLD